MAGSHRAARGGSRAAAREARRQKARKRNQTIAAGAAVVVLVGGGGIAALNAFGGDGSSGLKAGLGPSDDKSRNESSVLADDKALLDAAGAKTLGATGAWTVTQTADGSSAPEKSFVCQTQRFADPSGLRTWVRTFQNSTTKAGAIQYVDVSNDKATASKTYTSVVGWLGSCAAAQTRLIASYVTTGLGDSGVIALFATPSGNQTQYKTVAVSLAGQATMVLEHDLVASTAPAPNAVLVTAAAAIKKICTQTGGCGTGTPTVKPSLLPADVPGFMAPADLPIVESIDTPWAAASGTKAGSGTGCEHLDFKKATKYNTLTYVSPEAKVPTEFGLDDTVVKFSTAAAALDFVSTIRKNVDGCEKAVSNAKVDSTGSISSSTIKGKSWKATYDTGGGKKFTYRIGVAGTGTTAVYVLYPVLNDLDISDSAFNATLIRATERSAFFK